ncbi:MAG: hypothetical protein MOB07_13310 [Acidobacteria bacterium]|nr:hypothetical protein [Acidobacteriota bacterium]
MRKILKTFVVLVAALGLTSCAPSLHPFFIDEDIVFNDELLGEWINDSGEKCKFTKSGANQYEFLFVDEEPAPFKARLVELDGVMYLDLFPKDSDRSIGPYLANIVPAHTLARVTITEDSFSIAMMDGDWLKQLSDRKQLDLAHERLADRSVVLTAPTRELQAFVVKHADEKAFFGDADVFHRHVPDK